MQNVYHVDNNGIEILTLIYVTSRLVVACCACVLTAGGAASWRHLGPDAAGDAGGLGAAELQAEGASGETGEEAARWRVRGRWWDFSQPADVATRFTQLYVLLEAFLFYKEQVTVLDVRLVSWHVWIGIKKNTSCPRTILDDLIIYYIVYSSTIISIYIYIFFFLRTDFFILLHNIGALLIFPMWKGSHSIL